jgi:hypothetical protein
MSDGERKTIWTVGQADTSSNANDRNAYEYWLNQVHRLNLAKNRTFGDQFRRDAAMRCQH